MDILTSEVQDILETGLCHSKFFTFVYVRIVTTQRNRRFNETINIGI